MKLNIVIAEEEDQDYGGGAPRFQKLSCEQEPKVFYSVCNLNECPEDAIIVRDLFSAEDYINTLKLGMQLQEKGYTDIEIIYTKYEY